MKITINISIDLGDRKVTPQIEVNTDQPKTEEIVTTPAEEPNKPETEVAEELPETPKIDFNRVTYDRCDYGYIRDNYSYETLNEYSKTLPVVVHK